MARRKKRKFSPEYKREVVELCLRGDRTIAQVSRDLDLTVSVVRSWVKKFDQSSEGGLTGRVTDSEKEELKRLRRENRILRQEREILKKAAAFFAKEST